MDRLAEIVTPLPAGTLLFHRMRASEGMSRMFSYELELLSTDSGIKFADLLGKMMTVKLQLPGNAERYFNGYVSRFGFTGRRGRYFQYHATLRPWLWFLTRTQDCRIFQDQKVEDIIKAVFADHPVAKFQPRLSASYAPWNYCVQYRETDFNFVSRMMEQEGISYYFKHEADKHTLVLADSVSSHDPVSGYEEIAYTTQIEGARSDGEAIGSWTMAEEIQPAKYVLTDYDFERPSVDLTVDKALTRQADHSDGEIFDFPGEYTQRTDGEHYVGARLEEVQTGYKNARGSCSARGVTAGATFKLRGFPRAEENAEYLVIGTQITLNQAGYEGMGGDDGSSYDCGFEVSGAAETWRPSRSTPKPIVQGPQTAKVVGPDGDEIYTDKYGRVKVLFHWDRARRKLGKLENSSCWVRVSHPWAGKNFGFVAIPRIGQEVIVDFLEGDPDQPIITGRIYNNEQMPPWELPGNMTRTGLVTRSSKGGDASTANEFRFEDKKGAEQVYLHAEKNLDTEVEANETRDVGGNRTTVIHGNDSLTVHKTRFENVKGAMRDLLVEQMSSRRVDGGEIEIIKQGLETNIEGGHILNVKDTGQTIDVKGGITETVTGSVSQTITGGGHTQSITGGAHTQTVVGGAASHTASGGFTFTTPAAYAITAGGGVTITAPSLTLLGGASVTATTPDESIFALKNLKVTGISYEMKGINLETKGIDIVGVTMKGETVGFKKAEEVMNMISGALELKTVATKIGQGALELKKKALTLIA